MQVGIDVTCMHTNFGECRFSGFGDTATLKNGQISLSDHGPMMVLDWISPLKVFGGTGTNAFF